MPISNAYIPEALLPTEITKDGVVRSDSSHSLDSKSSENSEKLPSDSTPTSRLDSTHDSLQKSFRIRRSSIHKLGDFPNDQRAYYSDFYDSNEQLPADKKCMNFYEKNGYSNGSSESDIFKKLAIRRFSLNPEMLRKAETPKYLKINRSSLDDMDTYHTLHHVFSDWNDNFRKPASIQKSVGFEGNMSMSNGHSDDFSDSLSSSSTDSNYERSLRKSIRDYFKSRINRDSTSSLCTSQSSGYEVGSFPEETVDPFETLDEADEPQFLNSPILGNCRLPLHPSLLNLRSTEAEQMLFNLGFCDPTGIIPARFFPNRSKQENGEASRKGEKQVNLPENNELQNSKETTEDIISKNKKDTEVDSNVEHLLMNKKNVTDSCNKTSNVDFEEISRSTVHVINNNKPVFYKQKSILDEIEEANRNTPSVTFKNIPKEESSLTHNVEPNKNNCDQDQAEQNNCQSSCEKNFNVEKGEKDQSLEECLIQNSNDTENSSYSRISNIVVPDQISIPNISEKSQESFEIESIFDDSEQQSAEFRTETKKENDSNEEACIKSTDNRFLNSCSFLSVSCTSSPAESPLTVIDMSLHDNKDIQKRINNSSSSIDLDSEYTINNISSDDQFDEVFAYNSNFHCIQEDSSFSIKASDINNSGVEEQYSQDDGNCCWNAIQLNPYLTVGPDVVTIDKNSSRVNNEDHSNKKLSPPGFYTSSFNMFIKSPQKKRDSHQYQSSDERKRSHSKIFSPLVLNGIRFDGSEQSQDNFSIRGLGDGENGEDTTEGKVCRAAPCFSSGSKIGRTVPHSEKSEKKREEYCNLNDPPIENKDENCPEHTSRENKNDWPEIKVSKAKIIFKLESQNPCHNKISSKVIMKNIDHSQRRSQRQRPDPMSDNDKHTKDSWTQCNFEDYLVKTNSCNDDNINFPMQNLSKKDLLKNSCHPAADLHMESKGRKMLLNKKETLTSAIITKNGSINADLRYLKEDAAALDFPTDLNSTSQLPNNTYTDKAVLRLHKSSQTRIWGLHSLCKNELNICAKCLNHMNLPCLQPLEK